SLCHETYTASLYTLSLHDALPILGVVFLAERTDLGTTAAVKILRDAWLSPARRRRFADEQRTLARLNHPSIARLFDAGVLDDGTDRKSTRLNSSHSQISYAVFCLK